MKLKKLDLMLREVQDKVIAENFYRLQKYIEQLSSCCDDTPTSNVANGAGGSLLSGSGAPLDTLGDNGDFYFDTVTNDLYGPKTSGAWPLPPLDLDEDIASTGNIDGGFSNSNYVAVQLLDGGGA